MFNARFTRIMMRLVVDCRYCATSSASDFVYNISEIRRNSDDLQINYRLAINFNKFAKKLSELSTIST